jgi:uncharacterized membrane protein YjjB (DUF3815 family)
MILIPGIAFTHAVENLITGDTLSGLLSSCEALFVALALAGGFAVSMMLFGGLIPDEAVARAPIVFSPMMKNLIQALSAGVMGAGFGLLFGCHKKRKLFVIGVGSALTWTVYLVVHGLSDGNIALATFVAALFGSMSAIWAAQLLKAPKTVFLFPLLVSLVPGSDLYRMMQAALSGRESDMAGSGKRTLIFAFAIALGIIVSVVYQQANLKIRAYIRAKKAAQSRR